MSELVEFNGLIVDDGQEIRDAIGIYLANEGIRVIQASDGFEAIKKLD